MEAIIFIIIAYVIGSLNSAIIVSKIMGLPDPRSEGSGNPGATNVLRVSGRNAAIYVLIGDIVKGLIAVLLAKAFGVYGFGLGLVALAVFIGHLFPVFFKFQGGKGMATALGAVLGLSLLTAIAAGITWVLIAYFTRYSSLASMVAMVLSCIYVLLFSQASYFIPLVIMCALLIWRHQENIKRLRSGTENKIGKKST